MGSLTCAHPHTEPARDQPTVDALGGAVVASIPADASVLPLHAFRASSTAHLFHLEDLGEKRSLDYMYMYT